MSAGSRNLQRTLSVMLAVHFAEIIYKGFTIDPGLPWHRAEFFDGIEVSAHFQQMRGRQYFHAIHQTGFGGIFQRLRV